MLNVQQGFLVDFSNAGFLLLGVLLWGWGFHCPCSQMHLLIFFSAEFVTHYQRLFSPGYICMLWPAPLHPEYFILVAIHFVNIISYHGNVSCAFWSVLNVLCAVLKPRCFRKFLTWSLASRGTECTLFPWPRISPSVSLNASSKPVRKFFWTQSRCHAIKWFFFFIYIYFFRGIANQRE